MVDFEVRTAKDPRRIRGHPPPYSDGGNLFGQRAEVTFAGSRDHIYTQPISHQDDIVRFGDDRECGTTPAICASGSELDGKTPARRHRVHLPPADRCSGTRPRLSPALTSGTTNALRGAIFRLWQVQWCTFIMAASPPKVHLPASRSLGAPVSFRAVLCKSTVRHAHRPDAGRTDVGRVGRLAGLQQRSR